MSEDRFTWQPGDIEWDDDEAPEVEKAGGADRNRGGAEQLRHWYVHGEGAAQIDWPAKGSFERCVAIASEHMDPEQAKGYCANRHKEATGRWPGEGHHR